MGNCPSSFRGKFTPNQDVGNQGMTDIVLKPVDEDDKVPYDDSDDEKTTIPMIDGEEDSDHMSLSNGGSLDVFGKSHLGNSQELLGWVEVDPSQTFKPNNIGPIMLLMRIHYNVLSEIGKNILVSCWSYLKEFNIALQGVTNKAEDGFVPLIVELADLCVSSNTKFHYTDCFYVTRQRDPRLVVRRGSPVKLNLTLNRKFDPEKDVLCLVFTLKDTKSPSYSQNTEIILPVLLEEDSKVPSVWKVHVLETSEKHLILEVTPAPDAIIGEWILEIDSRQKDDRNAGEFRFKVEDPIVLLFNPWCENDSVYLADCAKKDEYVLADSGLIWRGSHNCLRPCVWNYGQFEQNVLECCLYLLTSVGRLSPVARADPIKVVRHISAVLNSRDDNGVLVGNWSGKYKGGKSPTCWGGSQMILTKYYKNKKPVKYGQCWVFSGVFTTVCRALGIPSRPVTNFSSAHDTHNSLTIDRFFDCHGKPLDKLNIDSIWNFHVWNEAWMQRPDLEPGNYGGWQAVDSTPQEESDGLFRCGPSSVAAIKRGEVQKAFDTTFQFAEVNADKVYWRYYGPNQPLKLIKKSTEEIGQCISTKAVGRFEREDITQEYKHVERSKEEREVMLRALRQCKDAFSRYYLNDDLEDVQFEFNLIDDIVIGEPFTVTLKAINKREEGDEYTVCISLHVHSALYTGHPKKLIKRDEFEIQLGPGVEQVMNMQVKYEDYERSLVDQCSFIISATACVKETGFDYCAQDDFRVRMPDIGIQVDGEIVQNQPITVTATLTNPLPKPLKNGEFIIEGPGLGKPLKLKMKGVIQPKAEARVKCQMTPTCCGEKTIIAKFMSKELEDVDGYHTMYVKSQTEAEKENNCHL